MPDKDQKSLDALAEIVRHDHVLTPGRYVGAVEEEKDGEPFTEKMARLTARLSEQFAESARLEEQIKENLAGLGYVLENTGGKNEQCR